MLKNLPLEVLEGGFDNVGYVGFGVIMEQDDLPSSVGSFC